MPLGPPLVEGGIFRRVALTSCKMVAGLHSSEEFDGTGGCDSHARNTASVAFMAGRASSGGKRCCAASYTEGVSGFHIASLAIAAKIDVLESVALPLTLGHIAATVHVACTARRPTVLPRRGRLKSPLEGQKSVWFVTVPAVLASARPGSARKAHCSALADWELIACLKA